MAATDPLLLAALEYILDRWSETDWKDFARKTGTLDIITGHERLLRSLSWNDPDYPQATTHVLNQVLSESVEPRSGEAGRMQIIAESMPDLPEWIQHHAPIRVRTSFAKYFLARASSEVPAEWREAGSIPLPDISKVDPQPKHGGSSAKIRTGLPTVPPTAIIQPTPVATTATTGKRPTGTVPFPGAQANASIPVPAAKGAIFMVHGHDTDGMNSVRIYVQNRTNVMPVSLAELPGKGQTIIEKFENQGEKAAYVIVMMSADDVGQSNRDAKDPDVDPAPRARQNVILELGYFYARLGRDKVLVMVDPSVEKPSDLAGVSYIEYPGENWMDRLHDELKEAGLTP